jgi:fructose-bisphosphate aldolase class 1
VAGGDRDRRRRPGLHAAGLEAKTLALARYAALCRRPRSFRSSNPEVLIDGGTRSRRCFRVTEATLTRSFHALWEHKILLEECS